MKKTITIYGAGYVGLVTASCFAELGNDVLVVDNQHERIENLKRGICPIFEPGLEELLKYHLEQKNLAFTTDVGAGVKHGFWQFITVGTPSTADGLADITQVFAVADSIGEQLQNYCLVVNKSTAPIGSAEKIAERIQQKINQRGLTLEFDIVANPEFLGQGSAIRDFMQPDRVVVGVDTERAADHMHALYAPLIADDQAFIIMDKQSAELTKYAANAYLAMRISFINEMSHFAEQFHADIDKIREGIGADRRIGQHFLFAGCGFGGSCFPKDVRALQGMARQVNYDSLLLSAITAINQRQKNRLFEKIYRYFNGDLAGKVVALWGLSFKPNTDDMREAPSRVLIEALLENKATVQAYDPAASAVAAQLYANNIDFKLVTSKNLAVDNADVLAIVTEWDEFYQADFAFIAKTLRHPAIFDGRNLYNPADVAQYGLTYYAIGRGKCT